MSKVHYDSAYKSYDIRSVYEDPIDVHFCYSLGKGIGKRLTSEKGDDATMVFGSDVREINNELIYRFLKGCEDAGFNNFVGMGIPVESNDDQEQAWGVTSTSMLYYITKNEFDLGVMFTASHCPPEYAGLKISDKEGQLIPTDLLKNMVESYDQVGEIELDDFQRLREKAMGETNPLFAPIESKSETLAKIIGEKYSSLDSVFKVIVDCSSGSAVAYEKAFFQAFADEGTLDLEFLCDRADSNFSLHLSDTQVAHDYEMLIEAVKASGADLGIMFDGDADRLGFVDNTGAIVEGDIIGGIIAANILTRTGSGTVVHDVFTSKSVVEQITALGGEAVKCKVGHTHVKKLLAETGAIFGCEQSGHLFFPEVGGFEFPLLALYYVLAEMEEAGSLSETAAPYQCYHKMPMKKFQVKDTEVALKAVKAHYENQGHNIDTTDGVGVYTNDFWFVFRSSNTEPVLKLVIETDEEEKQIKILDEVSNILAGK